MFFALAGYISKQELNHNLYSERKEQEDENWNNYHPKLLKAHKASLPPEDGELCSNCATPMVNPIRCLDCGPNVFFCSKCSSQFHLVLQFHRPFEWKVSN